jgi:hyperosmotically inducible protein
MPWAVLATAQFQCPTARSFDMRTYLWISVTAASLALLGCAEDGTRPPETNNTTPNTSGSNTTATSGANNTTGANSTATNSNTGRTTVSKPALGGGNTPATSATDGAATSTPSTPRTGSATSGTGATGTDTDATRADNSAVNQRDRDDDTVLPTDQSNDQKDLDLSAKIRQNILRNKEMSLKAQNVKIITTDDGKVTLRGPVASEDEKKKVEQIAHDAAGGADKVTSELEVAPE